MPIKIDFSEIASPEPIPAGAYQVTVTNADLKSSQRSDYPYINWEFTVVEGPYERRKLFSTNSMNPKSLWALQRTLTAMGADANALKGKFEFDPMDFIGTALTAVVSIETVTPDDSERAPYQVNRVSEVRKSVGTRVR